jgi:AsmA-like C-terminal region
VHGANIAIDVTGTAAEAKGEMLINGVLAKADWQHVFGAAPEKQPPLRIAASLDNSDRTQLGLELNDIVQGEVGMEVLVSRDARNERHVQVRADLVNAELYLESVAWRKPKGRSSVFQFDVVKGSRQPTELHNVKLVGDNVAIEGWMGIGSDHRLKEFRFPQFSLNVVGALDVTGKLRPDNVWDITAKGATYDGRDVFRSFFDVGRIPDQADKTRPGLDLRADIDTVIGFSDTSMRGVHFRMQKSANKLVMLDARGKLEGGNTFTATLKAGEARRLHAEASDAGQIFKVVGFYPNAFGGEMELDVNLDAKGPADRTGTLVARNFYVLGDPIVSEVLQNADGTQTNVPSGKRRAVVREKFEFDSMHIPFSVGHGQFVMDDSPIIGPLVSANIRGKVDFRSHRLDVGGTYVPLSVLNRALNIVPLLGPIFTGPRGEGLFGVTFGIKGDIANPQVTVNFASIFTPGIFREIMQMTPENPRVQPREKQTPRNEPGAARSSSTSTVKPSNGASGESGVTPDIGAGWSAEATDASRTKKK